MNLLGFEIIHFSQLFFLMETCFYPCGYQTQEKIKFSFLKPKIHEPNEIFK